MRVNLSNRINNLDLPKSLGLLPVYEAIVNSLQAIEDAQRNDSGRIVIEAKRSEDLLSEDEKAINRPIEDFCIIDNGIGFNDPNYESFITSDSDFKKSRGGKGVGRLHYLKAFSQVQIESTFMEGGQTFRRCFQFSKSSTFDQDSKEPVALTPELETKITLRQIHPDYSSSIPRSLDSLAQRIVEHCISYFLLPNCPEIILRDSAQTLSLNEYFRNLCRHRSDRHSFAIKENTFNLLGIRLYGASERENSLVFCAHGREVRFERLARKFPILRAKCSDELGEPFTYLGYITGELLDAKVNPSRTGFLLSDRPTEDGSLNLGVTIQDLSEKAEEIVRKDLNHLLQKQIGENARRVTEFVETVEPRYRVLLSEALIENTIERVTPFADERKLESELHQLLHERTVAVRKDMAQVTSASSSFPGPEEYLEAVRSAIANYNEIGMSALADYVAHRSVILTFLERAIQRDPEKLNYSVEKVVHDLIFPTKTTSDDVDFNNHNLWVIDDRLAFHSYLTSDKSLRSSRKISSKSDLRPDILIFDRALTFTEGESPVSSLTIVEFKRPGKSDKSGNQPIEQVTKLLKQLRTEHFKDELRGREIKLSGPDIPAYVFIVCDLTEPIRDEAARSGLHLSPDKLGFFGWIPMHYAYVEIIDYDKLLQDAKKRNRVFFERLGITGNSVKRQSGP